MDRGTTPDFTPAATSPPDVTLSLRNVRIRDVNRNGLELVAPDPAHQIRVAVDDSDIEGVRGTTAGTPVAANTGFGLLADSGAHTWLGTTTIFGNRTGLGTANSIAGGTAGVITDFCDNHLGGNDTDGAATEKACPQPPATVTSTVTTTAPAPPPQVVTVTQTVTVPAKPTPARCVVPRVTGLTLAAAKTKLTRAKCATGTVTRKQVTKASQVGRVVRQSRAPGSSLPAGTKIALTVGKK